ncbi:hypothetical protein TNCV_4339811 [Trichonephila clavipes]|nr:hypothetical protein TNCV_4339811 [Trichonephila clavipes]
MNPDSVSVMMTTAHVSRRTGQRSDPAFIVEQHTAISQGVTVWGAISWDTRSSLVVLQGTLTARRYVDDILTYPCYHVTQVPFINRIMLVYILRDSPNNVFKDMTSYHGLPGHQSFANRECLGRAGKATAAVPRSGELTAQMQRLWQDFHRGS